MSTPTYVVAPGPAMPRLNAKSYLEALLPTGGFRCLSDMDSGAWKEAQVAEAGAIKANLVVGLGRNTCLDLDVGQGAGAVGGFFILNAALRCGFLEREAAVAHEVPAFLNELDRERNESMSLVAAIRSVLPRFSEQRLGALVGVSRLTWHDWAKGKQVPRPRNRERLLGLKALLERRRALAPGEGVDEWLDTPVGAALDTTPAKLLAQERLDTVAILASRIPRRLDLTDGLVRELAQVELLDVDAVDDARRVGRLYALDEDDQ